MSLFHAIINSFNGGELSARMMGRTDTAVYQIALETCENFALTVEGPMVKRPGFEYICAADPTSTWLGSFKFNLTQHYVLEWGETKLRFFTNGARIETAPDVAYEVTTPYAAADAPAISFDQSFDRLYLAHADYRSPAALKRTAATTFAHEDLTLRNGPFADQNSDQTITVSPDALTGAVTLTASDPIFAAGQVGSPFYIEALDFSNVKAWEAGMKGIIAGEQVRSDGKIYEAISGTVTGSVQPIHEEGDAWDGQGKQDELNSKGAYGVQWRYVSDSYGIVDITGFTSTTVVTGTVSRTLPGSLLTVPSWRWAHSLISDAAGWPGLVKIWKGRMMLVKDFWGIGSVSGDYGGGQVNFASKTSSGLIAADLAFRRSLATPDAPHWIAGDTKLLLGTPSLELALGPVNSQAVLAGDNIEAVPQSFHGSQPVAPAQIGTSTLFVQRGGRKIRESGFDFARDRYVSNNIAVWARHIIRPGALQFAWQQEPEELLYVVRGDGQLAVHPHSPEQEIKGFSRFIPGGGGQVLSAVCIASEDGQADELWALIERGGVKRICRQARWREDGDPVEDAFFVDEGMTIAATSGQTHFTGADHLAGEDVAILANGTPVEGVTVAMDGSFDIPATSAPAHAFTLHVGLPYTARAVLLRPEVKIDGQTSQGVRQRLVKMGLRLLETIGMRVGPKDGKLDNLLERSTAVPMGAPTPLFTGDPNRSVSGNWGRDGQAEFVSDAPLPATIICAMPRIEVERGDP